jgi:hypothetical protein
MKTYTVLYAEDVPHYGQAEIEATDDDAAIEAARKVYAEGSLDLYDPDWDNTICKRIVHIEDQDGEIIAEDIAIDSYYLSHGEPQRRLCEAAATMLEALEAQEMAEHDPEAARRKGYVDHARDLRKAALAKARGQQ